MRTLLPSSRGRFRVRFSAFDVFWAAASPLLALDLRNAPILTQGDVSTVLLYCGASVFFCLISFLVFRLNEGISRYFSVDDAINVMKASCGASLMAALVLFSFMRLDGIPRSTPLIQILILCFGLLTVRGLHRWRDTNGRTADPQTDFDPEHVLMIGANRLTALYINFLHAYCPQHYRVIGILDNQSPLAGRTMLGVPIVGATANVEHVIREFELHGIVTDRIIIGGDKQSLAVSYLEEVGRLCSRRGMMLQFIPELIGLDKLQAIQRKAPSTAAVPKRSLMNLPAYHKTKRVLDFFASAAAILVLSPLFIVTALLVLIDVGTPLLFWQQRLGRGGHNFLLYKFRTFRPPFDLNGRTIPENQRLSWTGKFLRRTRLDELPQLFSVLVGDMSLIGPRPLLPHDQPADVSVRLSIRPGITGWAQANGGNLITPEEKGALDEWYVRNASFWLDLRIVAMTLVVFLTGEHRLENAVQDAVAARFTDFTTAHSQPSKAAREPIDSLADRRMAVAVAGTGVRADIFRSHALNNDQHATGNSRSDRGDHI